MRVFRRLEKIVGTPEGRLLLVYGFKSEQHAEQVLVLLRTVTDCGSSYVASMFLTGEANGWWRNRVAYETRAGKTQIETDESLDKEFEEKFLPCTVLREARVGR